MKPHHMQKRISWAREKVTWNICDWNGVVWSDEKRFNLDGPDGFAYYWHDLRREERLFSKRQNGGGSLMVWGAFAGRKKCELAVLNGKQNALIYKQTSEDYLLPFADQELGEIWVFQQNGASIHRAYAVQEWFNEEHIVVMDWPAKSPDLSPIENLWAILARKVYQNQRQFRDVDKLQKCVMDSWDAIDEDVLENLIKSMQKRCIEVLSRKGAKTKY